MSSQPDISFIIPAYNEEDLLPLTLKALQETIGALQLNAEIIVADDASEDSTALLARQAGARVVSCHHRQIAATRNSGARAAQGRHLIFIDADTVVSADVVSAAVTALEQGAVGGGARVRFEGTLPLYARIMLPIFWFFYRSARLAAGCFIFATREAFERAGGFNEEVFGAEECYLSRALGKQGRFQVLHEAVTTSGRKLRTYSAREFIAMMGRLAIRGPKGLRVREGLEIWYGKRRQDPDRAA